MPEIETIPLPDERAKRKEPIEIQLNSLDSWPEMVGPLELRFDWNSAMRRWIWEAHRDGEMMFDRAPVCLTREYSYKGYVMFMFIDPSQTETRVSARNLGDEVRLSVFAGPDSTAFEEAEEPDTERF